MVDELRVRVVLDRLGVEIDAELRDTARFRNLLVHGYTKVDDTRVVEILHERVDHLTVFRRALARAAGG